MQLNLGFAGEPTGPLKISVTKHIGLIVDSVGVVVFVGVGVGVLDKGIVGVTVGVTVLVGVIEGVGDGSLV